MGMCTPIGHPVPGTLCRPHPHRWISCHESVGRCNRPTADFVPFVEQWAPRLPNTSDAWMLVSARRSQFHTGTTQSSAARQSPPEPLARRNSGVAASLAANQSLEYVGKPCSRFLTLARAGKAGRSGSGYTSGLANAAPETRRRHRSRSALARAPLTSKCADEVFHPRFAYRLPQILPRVPVGDRRQVCRWPIESE